MAGGSGARTEIKHPACVCLNEISIGFGFVWTKNVSRLIAVLECRVVRDGVVQDVERRLVLVACLDKVYSHMLSGCSLLKINH